MLKMLLYMNECWLTSSPAISWYHLLVKQLRWLLKREKTYVALLLQYAEKLFVRKPKERQYPHLVAQQIWEAVVANDKKAVYRHIVNSEADVNAVYKQSSCGSLTLAKVMLLHEQPSLEHSGSCLTGESFDRTSTSSLNLGYPSEGQTAGDLDGCTLLHLACETADIGMLELLLQYGAYINATGSRGQTPLHCCILRRKTAFTKLLLTR